LARRLCLFSCSHEDKDSIVKYIINQAVHHKEESFENELRRLLTESGIENMMNSFLKRLSGEVQPFQG
jgi:hypothetical protein